MIKSFKVVCIEDNGSSFLKQGKIFDASKFDDGKAQVRWGISTQGGCEEYGYNKTNFLRLPAEPKNCRDMSMEEYLAMTCLHSTDPDAVQHYYYKKWQTCSGMVMVSKSSTEFVLRIKPEKSVKDIEIERIEEAMRKLADDLSKLKRE